jgi:hypothetical protein
MPRKGRAEFMIWSRDGILNAAIARFSRNLHEQTGPQMRTCVHCRLLTYERSYLQKHVGGRVFLPSCGSSCVRLAGTAATSSCMARPDTLMWTLVSMTSASGPFSSE